MSHWEHPTDLAKSLSIELCTSTKTLLHTHVFKVQHVVQMGFSQKRRPCISLTMQFLQCWGTAHQRACVSGKGGSGLIRPLFLLCFHFSSARLHCLLNRDSFVEQKSDSIGSKSIWLDLGSHAFEWGCWRLKLLNCKQAAGWQTAN